MDNFDRAPPWAREVLESQRRIELWLQKLLVLLSIAQRTEGSITMTLRDILAAQGIEKAEIDRLVAYAANQKTQLTDLQTQLDAAIENNDPVALQAVSDGIAAQIAEIDAALPPAPAAPAGA